MVPNLNRKLYRKRHNTDIKKEKRDLRKTYKKERKRSWVKLKKQNQLEKESETQEHVKNYSNGKQ